MQCVKLTVDRGDVTRNLKRQKNGKHVPLSMKLDHQDCISEQDLFVYYVCSIDIG